MTALISLQLGQLRLSQFLLGGNFQAFILSPAAAGTPCHYREPPGKGEGKDAGEGCWRGGGERAGMGKSPVGRKGRGWLQGGPPNPAGRVSLGTKRHPAGVVGNAVPKPIYLAGKANI